MSLLRSRWCWIAFVLVGARFVLRVLGGEEATALLAGNVVSEGTLVLGASYVVAHLAAVIVAPIAVIAALVDAALAAVAAKRRADRGRDVSFAA